MKARESSWPSLPLTVWADTCATLHMWTQIVGKIRLAPFLQSSYDAAATLADWNRTELEGRT